MIIRPSAAGVLVAVASTTSFNTASSQSTCSTLSVTGGVGPGVYTALTVTGTGKSSYSTTVDGDTYVLLFVEDEARRKLAGGSERGAQDPYKNIRDHALFESRSLAGSTPVHSARRAESRSLSLCSTGFWVNLLDVNETTYPWALTPDCAEHPANITAGWLEVACDDCDPTATTVAVDCADAEESSSTTSSGARSASTPTPTTSLTEAPVAPSISSETSYEPTLALVPEPSISSSAEATTPAPARSSTAPDGLVSRASGLKLAHRGTLLQPLGITGAVIASAVCSSFLLG